MTSGKVDLIIVIFRLKDLLRISTTGYFLDFVRKLTVSDEKTYGAYH
jgi:hypothetical protein